MTTKRSRPRSAAPARRVAAVPPRHLALAGIARQVRAACLPAAGLVLGLHGLPALAGPQGGQVVAGQGTVARPNATTTVINQVSQNLALDWTSFDVKSNELVQFRQPGASASALNRIFDQRPSEIYGRIEANGRVFLMNPNGVFFGPTARVNVQSLVAAGAQIDVDDFMAGNYRLQTQEGTDGVVINQGVIEAATGGSVTLAGNAVANEGVILANAGRVNLVSGSKVVLDFDGDGLMQFAVEAETLENARALDAAVSNTGEIAADGGQVVLAAHAAKTVFDKAINNAGVIRAGRIDNAGGQIRLVGVGPGATVLNTGTLAAAGTGGDGGSVRVEADGAAILDAGSRVDVSSADGRGGSAHVLGERVGLFADVVVDASGKAGGGEILVGGDFQGSNPAIRNAEVTVIGQGVVLNADALTNGDGGKVIVWADDTTRYYGEISARGGSEAGNGGNVEVSGHERLAFHGGIDTGAANGRVGTILLDPRDINITDTTNTDNSQVADSSILFADDDEAGAPDEQLTDDFDITDEALEALTGSITLQAHRFLHVKPGLSGGGLVLVNQGDGETVQFSAGSLIIIDSAVTTSGADIVFTADADGADNSFEGAGEITVNQAISTAGAAGVAGDITLTIQGGTGSIALGATLQTDGGNILLSGPVVVGAGGPTIDTETGGNNVAGSVTLSGAVSAGAVNRSLFIDASGTTGGAVSLSTFSNAGGAFLSDLFITTSGTLTLNGSISLDGATGGDLNAGGTGDLVIAANVTIDTEQGNNDTAGLVDFGTRNIYASGAGFDLVINTASTGNTGGNVTLGLVDDNAGGNSFLNDLSIDTSGSANGLLTLSNAVSVDANGADLGSVTLSGSVTLGAAVTIDTEQGNNAAGGDITLTNALVSGNAAGRDLTLNTATTNAASAGGAVALGLFGNNGGAGSFVNDLAIDTSGTSTAGALTLAGPVLLDNSGVDTGDLTLTGGGNVVLAASVTVDTEQGNDGNAGAFNVGASSVSGNGAGFDLTLNTGSTGNTGGAVTLGTVGNAAGSFLNDVSIDTRGTTNGVLTLSNAVSVDANAADLGSVTLAGAVTLGAAVTIDTEQGNNAAGGDITLTNAVVSAGAAGRDLTLNTATTNAASAGGAVLLGSFGNAGGGFVNDLAIDTSGTSTAGALTLAGNVLLDNSGADTGDLTLTGGGNVVVAASVTVDTEQGNDGNAGAFNVGASSVSGNGAGFDLTLNTGSTGNTGGAVTLGTVGNAAGSFLNDVSIDTRGTTNGVLTLSNALSVDAAGADLGSVTLAGAVTLGAAVTIDTEQGNDAAGGDITLTNAVVSAGAAGRDLTLNTATTNAASAGGAVLLGSFGNAGGAFVNDLAIDTSGTSTAGALTLAGNVSLDNSVADTGDLTLAGGGDVVLAANVTVDTEQGNDGNAGAFNLGASNLYANAAARTLAVNTASTGNTGGAVTLGIVDDNAGANSFIETLTVDAGTGQANLAAIRTNGALSVTAATINLNGPAYESNDGTITFTGPVALAGTGLVTINSDADTDANDGNISITGAVTDTGSDSSLTATAGTGTVALANVATNGAIAVTGAAITLNGTSYASDDGNVSFSGPVSLGSTGVLTVDSNADGDAVDGSITFSGAVTDAGNDSSLVLTADTDAVSLVNVAVNGALDVTAATITLAGGNYNTNDGNIAFSGAVELGAAGMILLNSDADTDATDGNIIFTGNVSDAGNDSGISANAGTGDIDVVDIAANLTISLTGANVILNGTSYASRDGDVSLTGAVDLASAGTVTLDSDADNDATDGAVTVTGAIADASTDSALTVDADTGTATLGDVAVNGALAVTATSIQLAGTSYATDDGAIDLTGAVSLTGAGTATLDSDADTDGTDGAITITGAVTDPGTNSALSIDAHTDTATLANVSINGLLDVAAASIALNGATYASSDGGITLTGAISLAGTGLTTLNADADADATDGAITLNGAVTDAGSNSSLTVTADTGQVDLDDITTNGNLAVTGGNIDLNGTAYTSTTGSVVFTGAVDVDAATTATVTTGGGNAATFGGDLTLTRGLDIVAGTGGVNFNGLVAIGAFDLTVVSSNITDFNGTVSGTTGSIDVTTASRTDVDAAITLTGAGDITLDKANISGVNISTAGGNLTFNGATVLDTGAVALASGGGTIDFNSTLDGTQNLTLTAGAGDIVFDGIVGTTALGTVTVNAAHDVTINQAFNAAKFQQAVAGTGTFTLAANRTLNASGGPNNVITIDSATITLGNNSVLDANEVVDANDGDIALFTDTLNAGAGSSINAGTGDVTLAPGTVTKTIEIRDGGAAGAFDVSYDIGGFAGITAGSFTIGRATHTGNITLQALTPTFDFAVVNGGTGGISIAGASAGATDLSLTAGTGGISDGTGGAGGNNLDFDALSLSSTGAIDVNTTVTTLAASGTSVFVENSGAVSIGSFGGVNGLTATTGNLTLTNNNTITLAQAVSATAGTASLTTSSGAIVDNDGDGASPNISAQRIELRAVAGIANGAGVDSELEINATDGTNGFAATTTTGDINVRDTTGGLTLGTVGSTTGVSITGGAAADAVRIRASSPLTVNQAVSNTGGGSITLAAEGAAAADDLTVNANVTTSGGNGAITLTAGDTVSLTGTTAVTASGTGAVTVSGGTNFNNGTQQNGNASGNLSMAAGTSIRSEDGNLVLRAPGDVALADADANFDGDGTTGTVAITADFAGVGGGLSNDVGAISDANGASRNIRGTTLTLSAGTGVGAGDELETVGTTFDVNVTGVGAGAGNAGIQIANSSDGLISINRLKTIRRDIAFAQSGLTAGGGGQLLVVSGQSGVTSGAGGAPGGHITMSADGLFTVAEDISSKSGSGGIKTFTGVTIEAGVSIQAGPGNISLTSTNPDTIINSDLIDVDTAITFIAPRDIILNALLETQLGGLNTPTDITLTADSDNNGTGGVWIKAAGQIVSSKNVIITGSDIFDPGAIANAGIQIDADAVATNDQIQATAATGGTVTLQAGAAAPSTMDIVVNGRISSRGLVSIIAPADVSFGAAGDILSNGGNILVTADNAAGNNGSTITMTDGALFTAAAGTITLNADGSVTLGGLSTTNNTGAAVAVTSTSGGIVDGGDTDVDIVADSGGVTLTAATAVGGAGAIDTTVSSLSATANAGSVAVAETNGLTLTSISAVGAGNDVTVTSTTGNITVASVTAADDVSLTATAGAIADDGAGGTQISADVLTLSASTGIGSADALETTIASLSATNSTSGSVQITEADGLTLTSVTTAGAGSDINVTSTTGDITVVALSAPDDVTLTATAGAIVDDGSDVTLISGDLLTLSAATGIGAADELDTTVVTLDALSTAGDIRIGEVAAGTTLAINRAATTGDDIDIRTAGGNLSVAAGQNGVSTTGAGTITLVATGGTTADLAIDDTVTAATGAVTLTSSGDDVTFGAGGLVTTTTGNVQVNAGAGGVGLITMADGASIDAGDGEIDLNGVGDVTIGRLVSNNAGASAISVTTTNGSILDGGDTGGADVELTGGGALTLSAAGVGKTIGTITNFATAAGDAIEILTNGQITGASTTDGDVFLDIGASTATFAAGAIVPGGTNDAILRSDGDLDISGGTAAFTLTAGDSLGLIADGDNNGVGNLILPDAGFSVGAGNLLLQGADILDTTDHDLATITAAGLTFNSAGATDTTIATNVTTLLANLSGTAGLTVNETNAITVSDIVIAGAGKGFTLVAGGNITVGDAQAVGNTIEADGTVTLDATGQIIDGDDAGGVIDIVADQIELIATTGIANGALLEIDAQNASDGLAATTASGDILVSDVAGGLNVGTVGGTTGVSITAGAGVGDIIGLTAASPLTINDDVTNAGGGAITLTSTADGGNDDHLTINARVLTTGGNGGITLNGGTDVVVNDSGSDPDIATSGSGALAVVAERDVLLNAGTVLETVTGNVTLTGDNAGGNNGGLITMDDTALVDAGSGTITLATDGDVTLGGLTTTNATASAVSITSTSGGILDGGDTFVDVVATAGTLTLAADTGIGDGNALETTVATLSANNTVAGNIEIVETDALNVNRATNVTGNVDLQTTDGTLTVVAAQTGVSTTGSGTITLTAGDGGGNNRDLVINHTVTSVDGMVTLTSAANDVTFGAGGDVTTTTADVQVNAGAGGNGVITMTDGAVINAGSGDIDVNGVGNVTLGRLVTSSNGTTAIDVVSLNGAVLDGGDTGGSNLQTGTSGRVTVTADTGIGAANAIETTTGEIFGSTTGTGNVSFAESSGLNDVSFTVNDGSFTLTAVGDVTTSLVDTSTTDDDTNDISISVSGANNDIFAGGINAGSVNDVTLASAAAQVNGSGAAPHVIADGLTITAATGIGAGTLLELGGINTLSATTTSGNIDIDHVADSAVTVSALTTGAGTITYDQTGAQDVTVTSATTTAGAITLTNDGGDLAAATVTAGGAASDATLTTTTAGDVLIGAVTAGRDAILTAAGSVSENGDDAGADITATAGDVFITAGADIDGTTGDTRLEIAAGETVEANAAGNIRLEGVGALTLLDIDSTGAGGDIDVLTAGTLTATDVVTLGDSITLRTTTGGVVATLVNAAASVSIDADAGNVTVGSVTAGTTASINADAGDIVDSGDNTDTDITAGGLITLVASGDIDGPASGGGDDNEALELAAGSTVNATAGSGRRVRLQAPTGLLTVAGGSVAGTGTFSVFADDVDVTGTVTANRVIIAPFTAGTTIGIAGGAGSLALSAADINFLDATASLRIGALDSGLITIGAWTPVAAVAGGGTITLATANGIAQTGAINFNTNGQTLAIRGGGNVALTNAGNNFGTIAANKSNNAAGVGTAGGSLQLHDTGLLTIGTAVDDLGTVNGITVEDGSGGTIFTDQVPSPTAGTSYAGVELVADDVSILQNIGIDSDNGPADGDSVFILRPRLGSTEIGIGDGLDNGECAGTCDFAISAAEFNRFSDGFAKIVVGTQDPDGAQALGGGPLLGGSHLIVMSGTGVTLRDSLELHAAGGGRVRLGGTVTKSSTIGPNPPDIDLFGPTELITANVSANNFLDDVIVVVNDVTIDGGAGDITFAGSIASDTQPISLNNFNNKLTIRTTGDIFFNEDIGDNTDSELDPNPPDDVKSLGDLVIADAANVFFQNSSNRVLVGSLLFDNVGTVDFNGGNTVIRTTGLTSTAAQGTSGTGTVATTVGIDFSGATTVNFNSDVALNTNAPDAGGGRGAVNLGDGASATTVDATGAAIGIASGAGVSLDSVTADNLVITNGTSLSLNGDIETLVGDINFSGITNGQTITLGGNTTLTSAGDVIAGNEGINGAFDLTVDAVGSITLGSIGANTALDVLDLTGAAIQVGATTTTGDQNYNGPTTLTGNLSSGGTIAFNDTLNAGANRTITATDVDITAAVTGTGTLTLQPLSPASTVGVGSGAGAFSVDDTELGLISGVGSLAIGRAGGTGAVDVDVTAPLAWNLLVRGGNTTINSDISAGSRAFGVNSTGTVALATGNDITSSTGNILLQGATGVTTLGTSTISTGSGDVTLSSTGGPVASGAAINTVNGTVAVTGVGVTLGGDVTAGTSPVNIAAGTGTLTQNGQIVTAGGNVTMTGATVDVNDTIASNGGNVTLGSGVVNFNAGAGTSPVDTGGGNLSIGSSPTATINRSGAIVFNAGAGTLTLNGNLTNAPAANVTFNAGSVIITGDISGGTIDFNSASLVASGDSVLRSSTNFVDLPGSVLGSGNLQIDVPTGVDLVIDGAGGPGALRGNVFSGFTGNLVIGGSMLFDPSDEAGIEAELLTLNANSITVGVPLVSNGNITLLAGDIFLDADITAGGEGGDNVTLVALGTDALPNATGSIHGPDAGTVSINAGSAALIAPQGDIVNDENIELNLAGGDVNILISENAEDPGFAPTSSANAVSPNAATNPLLQSIVRQFGAAVLTNANFVEGVIGLLSTGLEALAELGFIDISVFEQELELIASVGFGIAMPADQCEDPVGCAVSEDALVEVIEQIKTRIAELESRTGGDEPGRVEAVLAGFREQLGRYEAELAAVQAAAKATESGGSEFGDEFGGSGDEFEESEEFGDESGDAPADDAASEGDGEFESGPEPDAGADEDFQEEEAAPEDDAAPAGDDAAPEQDAAPTGDEEAVPEDEGDSDFEEFEEDFGDGAGLHLPVLPAAVSSYQWIDTRAVNGRIMWTGDVGLASSYRTY